jgi:putative hydrolase of the HAD superfamily
MIWSRRYARALEPFRTVFVSCEIGKRKPEPEAFQAVAAAIGVLPQRILFFDDSPVNVEGARAAGLRAVHVRGPGDVEESLAPLRD